MLKPYFKVTNVWILYHDNILRTSQRFLKTISYLVNYFELMFLKSCLKRRWKEAVARLFVCFSCLSNYLKDKVLLSKNTGRGAYRQIYFPCLRFITSPAMCLLKHLNHHAGEPFCFPMVHLKSQWKDQLHLEISPRNHLLKGIAEGVTNI